MGMENGTNELVKKHIFNNPTLSMEIVEDLVRQSNHKFDFQYHNCNDWARELYDCALVF